MRLIILFFFLINFSIAQKAELTGAIVAFNKGDSVTAKELIDISYDKYMEKIKKNGKQEKPKTMSKFWHYRGLIYFRINEFDIAIQSFGKDINLNAKGGYQKKSMKAINICATKYADEASATYQKASKLDFEKDRVVVNEYMARSADLFSKSYNLRANILKPALIDTGTLFNAMLLYSDIGDPFYNQLALEKAKELVELNPKAEEFQMGLLICLEKNGDNDLLLAAIESARFHIPNSYNIITKEVDYYLSTNDPESLKASLNDALELNPDNPLLYFAKGTALQSMDLEDEAISAYEKSIELNPDYFDSHNNIASIYTNRSLMIIDDMNRLGMKNQKKYNQLKKKRDVLYQKSIPHLEECIRLQPDNITMLTNLKKLYYTLQDSKNMKRIKKIIKSKEYIPKEG